VEVSAIFTSVAIAKMNPIKYFSEKMHVQPVMCNTERFTFHVLMENKPNDPLVWHNSKKRSIILQDLKTLKIPFTWNTLQKRSKTQINLQQSYVVTITIMHK
jgi:hypothetical protein